MQPVARPRHRDEEKAFLLFLVRVFPIGTITKGRLLEEPVDFAALAAAGAMGFSDDGESTRSTAAMVAALNAGANDYIQKPVNIPIAIARINAQLQRKQALTALADINRSLEQELAQRTRALMARQNEWNAGDAAQATAALNDILRLTSWLRNNDAAQDPNLRDVCLDSIISSARRLAAR